MTDDFSKDMLKAHNFYRKHHQAPPLTYDKTLAKSAQKWADKLAAMDKLEHDHENIGKLECGENVAMKYNSEHTKFTGQEFTDYWYSEIHDYKFDEENQIKCGHFTQVVWKSSETCGFGRGVSKSGKVYVVGRYKPPGNFTNEFCSNVLPSKSGQIAAPQTSSGASSSGATPNKPVIGPKNPKDIFLGSKKSVTVDPESKSKLEKIEETYQTPEGEKYTRLRENTLYL